MVINFLYCVFSLDVVCHWQKYQILSDAERRHDYKTQNVKCDFDLKGWHRFQGAAGTKMVTECPEQNSCDTTSPIWLNGDHPAVAQSTVTRNVCINKNACCKITFPIEVKNCGSYYIYNLRKLKHFGGCDARYCSTD